MRWKALVLVGILIIWKSALCHADDQPVMGSIDDVGYVQIAAAVLPGQGNKLTIWFNYWPNQEESEKEDGVFLNWDDGVVPCSCMVFTNVGLYWDPIRGDFVMSKSQEIRNGSTQMYMNLPYTVYSGANNLILECSLRIDDMLHIAKTVFDYHGIVVYDKDGTYIYYVPYFRASYDDWTGKGNDWTGVGLANLSPDAESDVSVSVYAMDGTRLLTETRTIAKGGQDAFVIGSGMNAEGWVRISSTQRLAGLTFIGKTLETDYMVDVPFMERLYKQMVIPHVALDEMWDTLVYLANPNEDKTTVTLTYVQPDGNAPYGATTLEIPAMGSIKTSLSVLTGDQITGKGRVNIVSEGNGIAAFAVYSNFKAGGGSYSGISAVDSQ